MHDEALMPDDGRRRFLGGVLGTGLLGLAGETGAAPAAPPLLCLLTPELMEGPFYIDQALVRSDIRDHRPGIPMRLRLLVVDSTRNCARVPGAVASIWHCDAGGEYSGYDQASLQPPGGPHDGNGPPHGGAAAPAEPGGMHVVPDNKLRFLRGVQTTRADGSAQFLTIYPGWYAPRAVHIHLKIHLGEQHVLTTQMFFDDRVSRLVHMGHPAYRARGASPVSTRQDPIAGAHPGIVQVHRSGDATLLLEGEFVVGIARA
ncbi:protocatechuate 3,4-dioxygenase [Cupriavidus sp. 2TAF22]|uniref:protocatechuate 3,4-dioxygenase n=1 Tax=unclassified Cupriavidus TaxID=2640874 RepID=UPI003F90C07A